MLVEDHDLVRSGLRGMLEDAGGIRVVAESATVPDAVTKASVARPDVVVIDVRLAGAGGIEAARAIRDAGPETRLLMLTSLGDEEAVFASIMAGASGYVLKQIRDNDLVHAVRAVRAGERLFEPTMRAAALDRLPAVRHRLSAQEEAILDLIVEGLTDREIAARLRLSEPVVGGAVTAILARLR
jgi:two-component system, NarL family, response regulator DevR